MQAVSAEPLSAGDTQAAFTAFVNQMHSTKIPFKRHSSRTFEATFRFFTH
jgi:hypothetical protein